MHVRFIRRLFAVAKGIERNYLKASIVIIMLVICKSILGREDALMICELKCKSKTHTYTHTREKERKYIKC